MGFSSNDLDKSWYTVVEVAKILGVSKRTVLNYKDQGFLEIVKKDTISNKNYIAKNEVLKVLRLKGMLDTTVKDGDKACVIYARVQESEKNKRVVLDEQISVLQSFLIEDGIPRYEVITDVVPDGTGWNLETFKSLVKGDSNVFILADAYDYGTDIQVLEKELSNRGIGLHILSGFTG